MLGEVLYVSMNCSVHQLNRSIVSSARDNNKFAGDVHAIFTVCSSSFYVPKLQQALWTIQEMDIRSDRPDPAHDMMRQRILEHTILRRDCHVSGCFEVGEEVAFDSDSPKAQRTKQLRMHLNGDWRMTQLVHH